MGAAMAWAASSKPFTAWTFTAAVMASIPAVPDRTVRHVSACQRSRSEPVAGPVVEGASDGQAADGPAANEPAAKPSAGFTAAPRSTPAICKAEAAIASKTPAHAVLSILISSCEALTLTGQRTAHVDIPRQSWPSEQRAQLSPERCRRDGQEQALTGHRIDVWPMRRRLVGRGRDYSPRESVGPRADCLQGFSIFGLPGFSAFHTSSSPRESGISIVPSCLSG